jgi:Domain of unknown function (DUF4314)
MSAKPHVVVPTTQAPDRHNRGGEPVTDLRPGDRIELIHCSDPHTRLRAGDRGTVTLIDDAGTVYVYWDEGSRCTVVLGEDEWTVLPDPADRIVTRPEDLEIQRITE